MTRLPYDPIGLAKHALKVVFWLAVASIPLAIDYVVTGFMVNGCMPGSECLRYSMPLIADIGLVGWAARALLWPLCVWFLGGRWLFHNIQARLQARGSR